jgi:hypothetical protein
MRAPAFEDAIRLPMIIFERNHGLLVIIPKIQMGTPTQCQAKRENVRHR